MSGTIDPDYLAEEWATDAEILERMLVGGNLPEVVRQIDVQFVGDKEKLDRLKNDSEKWGFRSASVEQYEDGWQIELQLDSDTNQETMRKLTQKYLEIEQEYGIRHDGWGCFSHNEYGPISNENPA